MKYSNKISIKEVYEKIKTDCTQLIDIENNIATYLLGNFMCSISFKEDVYFISIFHSLKADPEKSRKFLNDLNQVVPFGTHTFESQTDGSTIHHYRTFLPGSFTKYDEKEIEKIKEFTTVAQIAAAGGLYLLESQSIAKNPLHELIRYKGWLDEPETFPEKIFYMM